MCRIFSTVDVCANYTDTARLRSINSPIKSHTVYTLQRNEKRHIFTFFLSHFYILVYLICGMVWYGTVRTYSRIYIYLRIVYFCTYTFDDIFYGTWKLIKRVNGTSPFLSTLSSNVKHLGGTKSFNRMYNSFLIIMKRDVLLQQGHITILYITYYIYKSRFNTITFYNL